MSTTINQVLVEREFVQKEVLGRLKDALSNYGEDLARQALFQEYVLELVKSNSSERKLLEDLEPFLEEKTASFVQWLVKFVEGEKAKEQERDLRERRERERRERDDEERRRRREEEARRDAERQRERRSDSHERGRGRAPARRARMDEEEEEEEPPRERSRPVVLHDRIDRHLRESVEGGGRGRRRQEDNEERRERTKEGDDVRVTVSLRGVEQLEEKLFTRRGRRTTDVDEMAENEAPAPEDDSPTTFTVTLGGAKRSGDSAGLSLPGRSKRFRGDEDNSTPTPELTGDHVDLQDSHVVVNQNATKCAFFPHCTKADCPFFHPTLPCKNFPACPFGAQCRFIHPEVPCKFGAACTRPNCNFTHQKKAEMACKYGAQCTKGIACPFKHPPRAAPCPNGFACPEKYTGCAHTHPLVACKFGSACRNRQKGCAFSHATMCANGTDCMAPQCPNAHPAPLKQDDVTTQEQVNLLSATLPPSPSRATQSESNGHPDPVASQAPRDVLNAAY